MAKNNPHDSAEDHTVTDILEASVHSDLRQVFIREYCIDFHGTQAAIRAGYSKKGAKTQAARLLANVNIRKTIRHIKRARFAARDFGVEDIINMHIDIVESDKSSEVTKQKSAGHLERIWGMYQDKINVNLTGNLAERLANARKRK